MGLFGGSKTTKTTVKPDKRVAAILKDVVSNTQNTDVGEYIKKQAAQLTPEGKQALQALADSGQQKQVMNILAPRMAQGMEQIAQSNKDLQKSASQGVDVNQILDKTNALKKGLYADVQKQGLQGVSPQLKGNALVRRDLVNSTNRIKANQQLNPSMTNQVIGLTNQQNADAVEAARIRAGIGAQNVGYGLQGATLGQQALANQLQAGNINQQLQQTQYDTDWQNAIGQAQYGYNQLMNKTNLLGTVAPMAGYSTTSTQPGQSKVSQLAGLGMAGLSLGGQMYKGGAFKNFNSFNGLDQQQTNNAFNALGIGQDTPQNYQQNMQTVRNNAANQGGWTNTIGNFFGF